MPSVRTVSGNQGNAWQFGHAQLNGSSGFNVVFDAVRGNSFREDIAIDDVTVSDQCGSITTAVLPTTTPYLLASPNCTFEVSSICGYRQDIHDSAQLTRHQGQTDTGSTGPGFDHTFSTALAHYVYFEASDLISGTIALHLSPVVPIISLSSSHTGYCLKFWYHIEKVSLGTILVSLRPLPRSRATVGADVNTYKWPPLNVGDYIRVNINRAAIHSNADRNIKHRQQLTVSYRTSTTVTAVSPTSTITAQWSSTSISAYFATETLFWAAKTTETSSTTDRISSDTTVTAVPSTPTIITQSHGTTPQRQGYSPWQQKQSNHPTVIPTETSSTTDRIASTTTCQLFNIRKNLRGINNRETIHSNTNRNIINN
ncbi:MAM domain-containing glycosylphosphatidylinositol anchor protein 2 [Branchiostoma belcheri]|nr:MAM domain-containing glycosylphosphatidylinositol anchor protein 2 [Branchiostoma belcheri]